LISIFLPCENAHDYCQLACGDPLCYYDAPLIAIWNVIVNDMMPTIAIICCSIVLLSGVLYQKSRMCRPIR
ncbi:unnamed protein product, partial [Rotaria sp. Silwood2]